MQPKRNFFLNFSEIKLTYHPRIKVADRILVKNQEAATAVLRESWDSGLINLKEQFKIILLSNSCHVMGIADISSGGFDATSTDLRLIFATALKARSNNLILAHNHPSGSLAPSKEDVLLTQKIIEAGRVLHVTISDHIIMTSEGSYSMCANDLM